MNKGKTLYGLKWIKERMICYDLQKNGFCCNLRWKFSYQVWTVLNGTYVSVGLGVICDCDCVNDVAKLKKFSSIFRENSTKVSAVDTVAWLDGVCCDNWSSVSMEIPIWAMWEIWGIHWPKGLVFSEPENM